MDLKALNTKEPAETGAFLHLKHPVLGYPLYTGEGADETGYPNDEDKAKPVGCWVRGFEAPSVQRVVRRVQARGMRGAKETEQAGLDIAMSLIIRFENILLNGRELEATVEDKEAFLRQSDDLIAQVTEFAKDRRNFFGSASSD